MPKQQLFQLQFTDRVFPTVTLCHLNPWKKEEAMNADQNIRKLVEAYENLGTSSSEYGFSERLEGVRQQKATKITALMSERLHSKANVRKTMFFNDCIPRQFKQDREKI
ncbi:unnamed protein product [Strongylus vulgaris]|uniref:Uncharacterized protein n=1 Tax=Strongylus vulgaris TaxID=40348 RepID=A0A3P7JK41_STRVU|nr:unnamed protein product [Strongylus vulgaris]